MGHRGEGDEAHLDAGVAVQQVLDLLARPRETARPLVHHVHGAREIKQNHQVDARPGDGHLGEVPARSGHGQHRRHPQQNPPQKTPPLTRPAVAPSDQQVRQAGEHPRRPRQARFVALGVAHARHQPQQQRQQQRPQPKRLGEMKTVGRHAAPPPGHGMRAGRCAGKVSDQQHHGQQRHGQRPAIQRIGDEHAAALRLGFFQGVDLGGRSPPGRGCRWHGNRHRR